MNIWDKLSNKYDTLWVQKYSLTPSRQKVKDLISHEQERNQEQEKFLLLDIGCATGQLLCEIKEEYSSAELYGIDKSENMIELAKSKNADVEFKAVAVEEFHSERKFDFITCCHSFPYYPDKSEILQNISQLLKDQGTAIFIQASINNRYDKFAMSIVEKTAEKADYLSKKDFCALAENYFEIKDTFTIKARWFMPSICGFVMGKKI